MRLLVLLPHQIHASIDEVLRIVVKTDRGSLGILPNRLDCVAALQAGILSYETREAGLVHLAVDEGIIVKSAGEVRVSVRNAIGGMELGRLHEAVERQFMNLDEGEKQVRAVLARLESGFVRRFAEFHRA